MLWFIVVGLATKYSFCLIQLKISVELVDEFDPGYLIRGPLLMVGELDSSHSTPIVWEQKEKKPIRQNRGKV